MTRATSARPPARRSASSRSRPKPGGSRFPGLPSTSLHGSSRVIALVAFSLIAAALIAAGAVLVIPPLARQSLSLLGAGLVPAAPAGALLFWQWRRHGPEQLLRHHGRTMLGVLLLFVAALGFAALFRPPDLSLAGIRAAEVSLGGLLGQGILGPPGPEQALRIIAPLLAGTVIAVPRSLPLGLRGLHWLWRRLVALHLPQRSWRLSRRAAARFYATVARAVADIRARRTGRLIDLAPDPDELSEPLDVGYRAPLEQYRPEPIEPPMPPFHRTSAPAAAAAPASSVPAEAPPPPAAPARPSWNRWEMPAMDLLERIQEAEPVDQTQRARQIEEALASYGVDAKVVQIHVGPAVTQFGVEPGWDRKFREIKERDGNGKIKLDKDGKPKVILEEVSRTRVKVERIATLSNNLALALAAPSVRIEAPVPGKQVVGIEVPNVNPDMVPIRSVIEGPAFQRLKSRSKLALALGKGVAGDVVVADLARMPHLLIAGATGSGKSVCINSIICSILMHATPEEVRFLMVDPKRVELVPYDPIPHLLGPVIVEPEKVVGTLQFVIKEMEDRYRLFASVGVRNIEGYNRSPKADQQLPFWVIIIDELADLMMVAPYDVERSICRLAQLARATGIHLVVATQRPSVDVITGLIKANFPTRISFAVTSQIDSRTILDASGAEKLLGRGDMLYMATDAAKPRRVQGTYVSDADVERIVAFWSDDRFQFLRPRQFTEEMEKAWAASSGGAAEDEEDSLLERARELAETTDRISASFLQRRLRIGYPRAARLMEALRDEGYGDATEE